MDLKNISKKLEKEFELDAGKVKLESIDIVCKKVLKPRALDILYKRFVEEKPIEEISEFYGLSKSHINATLYVSKRQIKQYYDNIHSEFNCTRPHNVSVKSIEDIKNNYYISQLSSNVISLDLPQGFKTKLRTDNINNIEDLMIRICNKKNWWIDVKDLSHREAKIISKNISALGIDLSTFDKRCLNDVDVLFKNSRHIFSNILKRNNIVTVNRLMETIFSSDNGRWDEQVSGISKKYKEAIEMALIDYYKK